MDITVGTIVYSKAGHDKKNMFLVLKLENEYAYIADGDMRRAEKSLFIFRKQTMSLIMFQKI